MPEIKKCANAYMSGWFDATNNLDPSVLDTDLRGPYLNGYTHGRSDLQHARVMSSGQEADVG